MKYKMIAIDMDGTLLNSEKKIGRLDKEAIRKASEDGIKVIICTGRIYASARFFAKELNLKTPIVACNGGLIKFDETGEVLFKEPIPNDEFMKVMHICDEMDFYYHAYDDKVFYSKALKYSTLNNFNWNKKQVEEDRINIKISKNIKSIILDDDAGIIKILVVDEDKEKLMELKKRLMNVEGIEVSSSWWNNVEIMKKGVQKGRALEMLCSYFGVEKEDVIAIGDNENDLSMIKYANMGVAMGNATDLVKAESDFVTDTNDNHGVCKAIEELVYEKSSGC